MAKLHFVLVAVCFVALVECTPQSEQIKKLASSVRKKCLSETGVSPQAVDDAELGHFPDDRKLACYFKCILERFNMISKTNQLNFDLMRKIIPEEYKQMGNDMIDECVHIKIQGDDRCQLAFDFNKCLFYANPVAYFTV